MIRKNVASQTVYLPQLRLTADGSAVTTGASLVVAKDGVEAAAAGTLAHYAGGIWKYTPTQGETNCAIMALVLTATGADTVLLNILTTAANPQDATAFGIGNLDAAITSRMATYTQPTGFLAATFPGTVASPTNITSATGVTLVAGTGLGNQTSNITGNLSGSVGSVTGNVGGNVVGSVASVTGAVGSVTGNVGGSVASVTNAVTVGTINNNTITAASIAASALDSKGNWNIGKTGYALTAGTGLGNQTANITGNLSGSVNSVTTRVTANTDQWNGVAVTGMPMPTFTLPANFSSLFITAGGYVIVSGDAFGNTFLIPNLASQTSVDTLATYVDTEVAAIKAKTDNLPASPAAVSDIPTANQNRDALLNASPTGGWTNGSFGDRWLVSASAQRTVAVTGSNHVAADIHELQAGVITAAKFAAGAIDANALAADAALEIVEDILQADLAGYAVDSNIATAIYRLFVMTEADGADYRFTTNALEQAPAGGGGGTVNIVVEDRSITVE